MAKIKKERIILRDPETHEMEGALVFDVNINVSSDGLFYTTLPDETSRFLIDMNIELESNRKGKLGYFSADSLNNLINKIKIKCADYFEREVIYDKIVIKYSIGTYCNYVLSDEGSICPNGTYVKSFDGRSHLNGDGWKFGTNEGSQTERLPFSIGIYARPMRKLVYKYLSGKTTYEYKNVEFDFDDDRHHLKWLNGLIRIAEPENGFSGELEYTEDRAKFFVDILKGICNMNEKIKPLFENKENLTRLIDNGTKLLG